LHPKQGPTFQQFYNDAVIPTAYIKSGRLLPLTADGAETDFFHIFRTAFWALGTHLLNACFSGRPDRGQRSGALANAYHVNTPQRVGPETLGNSRRSGPTYAAGRTQDAGRSWCLKLDWSGETGIVVGTRPNPMDECSQNAQPVKVPWMFRLWARWDELADAQRDLARAVGDKRATIQQELAAHEAAMRKYDAEVRSPQPVALVSARQDGTVATRLKAWLDQRTRYQLIQQALHQAQADAVALTAQHDQLENQASVSAPVTTNSAQPDLSTAPAPPPHKASMLTALLSRTAQRELLSIYDDRIQTQQQLASLYGKWSAQVLLQHRIVLHLLLQSFALIAFILLCVILFDTLVRYLVRRPGVDRRRMYTRRILLTVGIQLIGLLLILVIVFGTPRQMPTIVGLTTAGLTVALQDFILAFFGWFVLMGKNGIRVGDWVEINGVGGEIV
jgi:hypothetical protein